MQARWSTVIHQCKHCQALTKQRNHFVERVAADEFILLIDLCELCIEGNISLGNTFLRFWPIKPTTTKTSIIKVERTNGEDCKILMPIDYASPGFELFLYKPVNLFNIFLFSFRNDGR